MNDAAIHGSLGSLADAVFYASIVWQIGFIGGGGLAFGITALGAVLGSRDRKGRILGGALFGGLSFALAFFPTALVQGGADATLRPYWAAQLLAR